MVRSDRMIRIDLVRSKFVTVEQVPPVLLWLLAGPASNTDPNKGPLERIKLGPRRKKREILRIAAECVRAF